jgi:hypothetical protein
MIALLSQWASSDEREARRSDRIGDRRVDDELDAYNRMLAGLADKDTASLSTRRDSADDRHELDPDELDAADRTDR